VRPLRPHPEARSLARPELHEPLIHRRFDLGDFADDLITSSDRGLAVNDDEKRIVGCSFAHQADARADPSDLESTADLGEFSLRERRKERDRREVRGICYGHRRQSTPTAATTWAATLPG
jgi:hypothetical protein